MFKNIVDIFKKNSIEFSEKIIFTEIIDENFIERNITFSELDSASDLLAKQLLQINSNKLILILLPQGIDFIITILAIFKAGKIAIPCSIPKRENGLARLIQILNNSESVDLILHKLDYQRLMNRFPNLKERKLNWHFFDTLSTNLKGSIVLPKIEENDIAFIQYTSGSTNEPKGVIITHKNIVHNSEISRSAFAIDSETISVCWLPNFHDLGLVDGILQPIFSGFRSIIISPIQFTKNPAIWINAIHKYKATYTSSPNFGIEYALNRIKSDQIADCSLQSLKFILTGAEPIRWNTLERFVNRFKDIGFTNEKIIAGYGMAEATLNITTTKIGIAPMMVTVDEQRFRNGYFVESELGKEKVSSGVLTPNCDVVIRHAEHGTPLFENEIGEIWVASESIGKGYWNNLKATEENFNLEGKYLKTGDLGVIYKNNLFVTGRLKEVIIINGKNHYPQDIEQSIVEASPLIIQDAISVVSFDDNFSEKVVAILEVNKLAEYDIEFDKLVELILKKVFSNHEISLHDVVLLHRGAIHKTTSGKIQRKKNLESYLIGSFTNIYINLNQLI